MKTLRFLIINLFIRDHRKTLEIMNGLYNEEKVYNKSTSYNDPIGSLLLPAKDYYEDDDYEEVLPQKKPVVNKKVESVKPKSKKDELLEGLKYLKSKQTKTKKDKESIYTLELLLKNMS